MSDNPQIDQILTFSFPEPVLGEHWQKYVDASQAYQDACKAKKIVAVASYADYMGGRALIRESVVRISGPAAVKLRQYIDMDGPDKVPTQIIGLVNAYVVTPMAKTFNDFLTQTTSLAALLDITLPKSDASQDTSPSN